MGRKDFECEERLQKIHPLMDQQNYVRVSLKEYGRKILEDHDNVNKMGAPGLFQLPVKRIELDVMEEKKDEIVFQTMGQAAQACRIQAEKGDIIAQFHLGWMYQNGRGVEQNDQLALQWFWLAAEQEHREAQFSLGFMFLRGAEEYRDDKEAKKWFQRSADQGYAKAQCSLGWMYENGLGSKERPNYKLAVHWYRLSAVQGNARAEHNLGRMYLKGKGVACDLHQALGLFRSSAQKGYKRAFGEYVRVQGLLHER